MSGKVEITNTGANTTIALNGNSADITAGGAGQDGDLVFQDATDKERIRIGHIKEVLVGPGGSQTVVADYWGLLVRTAQGQKLIQLGTLPPPTQLPVQIGKPEVGVVIGDDNLAGSLIVKGQGGVNAASLDQDGVKIHGDLEIGGQITGPIHLSNPQKVDSIVLDGVNANLRLGGNNTAGGDIALFPKDATSQDLNNFANAIVQLNGNNGVVVLRKKKEDSIVLNPELGNIGLGGPEGAGGTILLYPEKSKIASIVLDGQAGAVATGVISIKNSSGDEIIRLDQSSAQPPPKPNPDPNDLDLVLDKGGRIAVKDWTGKETVVIDGTLGDIIIDNADAAEDFEVSTLDCVDPGTVMVIDQECRLRPSSEPYDHKVAGVISGAGNCRPGIVLGKNASQRNRKPIAVAGKVYCKVDAQYSSIDVGDLLTTSPTSGHAMKAVEPTRAFGTVIGKALAAVTEGKGLIPILVALQ